VWAGFTRQDDFGDALADRFPDWPVRRVVKRVENGERRLNSDEIAEWAHRVAELTEVPEWFLLSGWEAAAEERSMQYQLEVLREAVERHYQLLLRAIRNRPAPAVADVATKLRQAARSATQKQAEHPEHTPRARRDQQG
jgi:hypothetical protein